MAAGSGHDLVPPGSARGTRSGSRRACRSTATSSTATRARRGRARPRREARQGRRLRGPRRARGGAGARSAQAAGRAGAPRSRDRPARLPGLRAERGRADRRRDERDAVPDAGQRRSRWPTFRPPAPRRVPCSRSASGRRACPRRSCHCRSTRGRVSHGRRYAARARGDAAPAGANRCGGKVTVPCPTGFDTPVTTNGCASKVTRA